MEWVEISAGDVDTAKEQALDQLGVAEDDAEFEVLEEPRPGLFGRTRGEARIRARVRPQSPRPKAENRRRGAAGGRGRRKDSKSRPARSQSTKSQSRSSEAPESEAGEEPAPDRTPSGRDTSGRGSRSDRSRNRTSRSRDPAPTKEEPAVSDVTIDDQARIAAEFVEGLMDAFGYGDIEVGQTIDDDTVQIDVTGPDLGLLIGPKGQTMQAVQELMRTAVQRETQGSAQARLRLDVGGYRAKRAEALGEFTRRVADEVKESGREKALEPMHPADRKVVHDTVNEIDGVETYSEGEEPRRRVVIRPTD